MSHQSDGHTLNIEQADNCSHLLSYTSAPVSRKYHIIKMNPNNQPEATRQRLMVEQSKELLVESTRHEERDMQHQLGYLQGDRTQLQDSISLHGLEVLTKTAHGLRAIERHDFAGKSSKITSSSSSSIGTSFAPSSNLRAATSVSDGCR